MQAHPVTVAIHYKSYGEQWRALLDQRLNDFDIRLWPDWGDLHEIDYAVVWTPSHGLLQAVTRVLQVAPGHKFLSGYEALAA